MNKAKCAKCKVFASEVNLRQSDELLCNKCEAKRRSECEKLHSERHKDEPQMMTAEKAAAAVLATNIESVKHMTPRDLDAFKINNLIQVVRASMSSILPPGSDRTLIANYAMEICQKVKKEIDDRKISLQPPQMSISQSILLDTPLRMTKTSLQASPRLTTPKPKIDILPSTPKPVTAMPQPATVSPKSKPVTEMPQPNMVFSALNPEPAMEAAAAPATTISANKVTCIAACRFHHLETKGKTISCSLCDEAFHRVCVGVKVGRQSMWICPECKEIPLITKNLTDLVRNQQKELTCLRNENDTLAKLIEEQRKEIARLSDQSAPAPHTSETTDLQTPSSTSRPEEDTSVLATSHSPLDTNTTLIIGDSIIKGFDERGLVDTTIKCIPGAKVQKVKEELEKMNISNFKAIFIHAGTNNCTSDSDLASTESEFRDIVNIIGTKTQDATTIISSVCPRTDKAKNQKRVDKLNIKLKSIANTHANTMYVDNDDNFKANGKTSGDLLNGSGLHLTKLGTRTLLSNMNRVHKITKGHFKPPSHNESRHEERRQRKQTVTRPHPRQHDHDRCYSSHDGRPHDNDSRSFAPRFRHGGHSRNCHYCGGSNHVMRNCHFGRPVQCHECGEFGHKKNNRTFHPYPNRSVHSRRH